MSHKATAWAMEQRPKTPLEKLVLLILADCHNSETNACFPSMPHIADKAGCTPRGAIKAIESLEKQGFISVKKEQGKSNQYELNPCTQFTRALSSPVNTVHVTREHSSGVPVNTVHPNLEINQESNREPYTAEPKTVQPSDTPGTAHLSQPAPAGVQDSGRVNHKVCPPRAPDCPHQAIVDLYHESLPTLTRHVVWNETRRKNLQARWRESAKRQTLDWWKTFFAHVAASDFLMGRTQSRDGRTPFQADLEWLTKPGNFAKVVEGKYHQ